MYIGSVTARHSSSRRQPNVAAWYKEWNYGTFKDGATYMAGRPSRWASAHISSYMNIAIMIISTIIIIYFFKQ